MARGLGTRMQRPADVALGEAAEQAASRGWKALVPLAGRPLLDYVADSLIRAGTDSICLVVAPEAEEMRAHAERIARDAGVSVECAVQDEPRGTADAVLAAEDFAGSEPFLVSNGDNVYADDALAGLTAIDDRSCWVAAFERQALCTQGNIAPQRVQSFAAVTASPDGHLRGIVEKPPDLERYVRDGRLWVNMNLYRFTPDIFGACRSIEPDPERGELELTAAVALAAATGPHPFRVLFTETAVFDLTTRSDIPRAEQMLGQRRLCF
jgi:glucose-1-phosphate thymidylyltransferase